MGDSGGSPFTIEDKSNLFNFNNYNYPFSIDSGITVPINSITNTDMSSQMIMGNSADLDPASSNYQVEKFELPHSNMLTQGPS
jgi:hypothetical protein